MRDALRYIENHPGTPILPVAEYVGPNGSRRCGYCTVHRLLATGLVVNTGAGQVYRLAVVKIIADSEIVV